MPTASFPPAADERVYAVGDVHGCETLFGELMRKIKEDNAARQPARTRIILLGDVVDRGEDSASLLRRLMRYSQSMAGRFCVLMGNHELLMHNSIAGDLNALAAWMKLGGDATLASFGVPNQLIVEGATERLLASARRAIEPDLVLWLERLPLTLMSGALLFVHAGVRPQVALADQSADDLLWIREPFLLSTERRDYLTVHGHSICKDGPLRLDNRVALDTGAFQTGKLSAAGFYREESWFIST